MPMTLAGCVLGAALFFLGVKKERKTMKTAGLIVIAAIVIFWVLLLLDH